MERCMGCMAELPAESVTCPACGYAVGTPPKEAYHLTPGAVLNERYIVGRVLGYGGFGVTYLGWDTRLSRKVAIKEYLPSTFATRVPGHTLVTVYQGEATEQFGAGLGRFVEEAQRLAQFNGVPGIVDIYDTFSDNSTAYIVMQFLQGRDVKDLLAAEGPLPYERARDIVLGVCDTMAPVHEKGIIHRDISPDNIFITDSGEIKLLDFGASRYATSVNSKSLSVILKAGYAPEEQYRSRGEQGPWSDVYALAATFYKMLTGVTPPDAMERAIKDELEEPSRLGAELPKSAENAVMNALNVKQSDRTPSAASFKAALQADGVKRVKGKTARSDAGTTPPWVKKVLVGAVAALLALVVLAATGVLDLGQGNILKDTFGSAVPEGHVNAPGIVNLGEEAAKAEVTRAGLDYLIVGTDYDDEIEKGRILTQQPAPGQVVAVGSRLEVRVSGGSEADALAAPDASGDGPPTGGGGTLPDLTYKTAGEAIGTVVAAKGQASLAEPVLLYSDDVAEGLVIGQQEAADGTVTLTVSAGRAGGADNVHEPRAPVIVQRNGEAMVKFVPSAEGAEGNIPMYAMSFSTDGGGSWQVAGTTLAAFNSETFTTYRTEYFNQVRFNGVFTNTGDIPKGGPEPVYFPIAEVLALHNSGAADQTLTLRVDSYDFDTGALLYSKQVKQAFTFNLTGTNLHMSAMRYIEWSKLTAYIEDGRVPKGNNLFDRYHFVMGQGVADDDLGYVSPTGIVEYAIALDSIGFEMGEYYRVKYSTNTNTFDYICPQDDTLAIVAYNGKTTVWVYNMLAYDCEADGSVSQVVQSPGNYTLELPGA